MRIDYDIVVVGAGPAGSVLAYTLAGKGISVLVLEKSTLPRFKACAGGVSMKAVRSLPFDVQSVVEVKPLGGVLAYRGVRALKRDVSPEVAWLVMRADFDHFLAAKAVEAGAVLKEGVTVNGVTQDGSAVTASTNKGEFSARFLVGADGIPGVVARSLGLFEQRRLGMAVEAEIAISAAALEAQGPYVTFDFGACPHGYGWIFPKRDHLSVGFFQAQPGRAPDARQKIRQFVNSFPYLQENFDFINVRGHHIPLGGQAVPLHRGRALLVGDAASLADPWLGEGIPYAIRSARLAAVELVAALNSPDPDLSGYTSQVNAEIVTQLCSAGRFAGILYRVPRLATTAMARGPLFQEAVFSVVRGEVSFREFNRLVLRRLFPGLVQVVFSAP